MTNLEIGTRYRTSLEKIDYEISSIADGYYHVNYINSRGDVCFGRDSIKTIHRLIMSGERIISYSPTALKKRCLICQERS